VFCNLNELFLFNSNFTVAQNISFDGIIRTGLQVAECLRILIALADNPDLGSPPGTLRPPFPPPTSRAGQAHANTLKATCSWANHR
jgi:hypothetical protein